MNGDALVRQVADTIEIIHTATLLAQWMPWAQLASAALVAGSLGWCARMLREKQLRRAAGE